MGRHDLLALTAAKSLIGTLGLTPLVRASTLDAVVDFSAADAALISISACSPHSSGTYFWNIGLRGLGPTRAVAYTYAISPLAVLIGAAVPDEALTMWLGLGAAALVVGGIALAQRKPATERSASVGGWRSAPSRSGN